MTLDAQSELLVYVNGPGTIAGGDYSRLSITGNVDLAGATLLLTDGQLPGDTACAQLSAGDVLTIVSATGQRTGTFANAADNATLPLACMGSGGAAPQARITYTANGVTATIVSPGTPGAPTTTALSVTPAQAVTNEPLTLTATVASGTGAPSGTVRFRQVGDLTTTPIAGCESQPVTQSGGVYTATCQRAFPASPVARAAAVFIPTNGSPFAGSASDTISLPVARATTVTSLTVSPSVIGLGQPATFVAHVAPGTAGATQPSGTVTFLGNGQALAGCTSIPVTWQGSSADAGCVVSIATGTARTTYAITVVYAGDENFTASTSPAETVTFAGSPAASPAPTRSTVAAAPPPAPVVKSAPLAPGIGTARVGRASASANMLNVVVTCRGTAGQRCTVALKLTIPAPTRKAPARTTVAGLKKVTLRAGDGLTAHVRLNALAATKLRRARKLRVTLAASEQTKTGTKALPIQRVTFTTIRGSAR